jgi:hypothetical protein
MILSITIATISLRKKLFDKLYSELLRQIKEYNLFNEVEILIDNDNDRYLGTKRKMLLDKAKGLFTCAIDDDDNISADYLKQIIDAIKINPNVDCIGINGTIIINNGEPKQWFISCKYEDWFEENNIYFRTPNHITPIKTELVRQINFDEVPWGEDYNFSKKIKPLLINETIIESPIYIYNYNTTDSLYQYQQNRKKIKLSILIPTVPSRINFYNELIQHIDKQKTNEIEIITDNTDVGIKTTGQKRNDLLMKAVGEYVWFIDDDDWISDTAIEDILEGIKTNPDSFAINGTYTENGQNKTQWFISKDLEYCASTINGKEVYLRPPNHITPMKRNIAIQIMFPDKSNAEDYDFCIRLKEKGLVKTEYKIEKPIYEYRYLTYNKLY